MWRFCHANSASEDLTGHASFPWSCLLKEEETKECHVYKATLRICSSNLTFNIVLLSDTTAMPSPPITLSQDTKDSLLNLQGDEIRRLSKALQDSEVCQECPCISITRNSQLLGSLYSAPARNRPVERSLCCTVFPWQSHCSIS